MPHRPWFVALLLAVAACAPTPGGGSSPKVTSSAGIGKPASSAPGKVPAATTSTGTKVLTTGEIHGLVVGPKGYKAGAKAPAPGSTVDAAAADAAATGPSPIPDNGPFVEYPVANVQVYLASKLGERFEGPTVGEANANGEFVIKNVPTDLTFLVMTNTTDPGQHHAELCAPMQNLKTAANTKISFGTTLVTLNTVQNMAGNALGQLNAAIYVKLTASVDAQLKTLKLNELPDLDNPKAIQDFMARVTVDGQPATALVDNLRNQLGANGIDANSVQNLLNQINISGSGSASVNGQTVAAGGGAGTIQIPPELAGWFNPQPQPDANASDAETP